MAKLFANDTIGPDYKAHMQKEHHGSKWGSTGYRYSGKAIEAIIDSRPYLQTAFDYGCGKGTVAMRFARLGWTEYDPGIPGKDTKPNGTFDLVTCTDVIEHIEEKYVKAAILEMANYTDKVLFLDIACYPTGKLFGEGPYKGEDMHITIKAPEVWEKLIESWDIGLELHESYIIKKMSKGKMKPRIQLTYERV